ncbi:hypothetical protein GCM10027577_43400 [Spirosoma fluminis]
MPIATQAMNGDGMNPVRSLCFEYFRDEPAQKKHPISLGAFGIHINKSFD